MKSIEIQEGKIFIEGVETTDPVLIGYAIIDLVQDGKKLFIENSIEEVFSEKDIGYLRTTFQTNKHLSTQERSKILGYEPWKPGT